MELEELLKLKEVLEWQLSFAQGEIRKKIENQFKETNEKITKCKINNPKM